MKKILVGVAGGTILALGVVMLVAPGPAIVVIPIGLGILATEFAWARKYKERMKQAVRSRKTASKP